MVGLAGFAFGLVASGIWLYILSPVQTATMILCFGFLVQSYAVWVQRDALDWRRIWPMVLGSAVGIPIGIAILTAANPVYLRMGVGAVLVLYSVYGLARPAMKPLTAGGVPADIGAGVVNGILGGTTGLAGVFATIWCQLRGGPRDRQRAVFQPVGVLSFVMCGAWLGGRGEIPPDTWWLVLLGLRRCGRMLARLEALWPARRGAVPQGRADPAAGVGDDPDLRPLNANAPELIRGVPNRNCRG